MTKRTDVVVVGAGLIGLAVARSLAASLRGLSIIVVDKEAEIASHQSGHNSGVIHSGLYYRPGSLKARLCTEGRRQLYELCATYGVEHNRSGKLVIATRNSELAALDELERRGRVNGLEGIRRLDAAGIRELEPEATGIAALHIPDAGVVDFVGVARVLAGELRRQGGSLLLDHEVTSINATGDQVVLTAGETTIVARLLVNCAGLQSDRVARLAGVSSWVPIVPFRGEYYRLRSEAASLVRTLIYPVPDPRFPFLGVHFTRRFDGIVEVGPNAVLALGREQYRGVDPEWSELGDLLRHRGFRRFVSRHLWSGSKELIRSRSRMLYARAARRLVPALQTQDLVPGGAGVRAQAIDETGRLVDDFVIETAGASVHVLNAPSPGATASLAIGRHIATIAERELQARTA